MKTLQELIKKLNSLDIVQKDYEFESDLPEEYESLFSNCVDSELDIDRHRWYETAISVFDTDLGFLGVRHITLLYSETMDYSDAYHTLEFFEMEPKEVITYKKKI